MVFMSSNDGEITAVFDEEAVHGGSQGRRMHPIDGVHFLDENALSYDGAD